ncbi:MAG: response regulator [Candidatus Kryptoniota bacterium]
MEKQENSEKREVLTIGNETEQPLSVGQAARILRVSSKTILNWIRAGRLKAYATPGGHFRVWPSDLNKFIKAHKMDIQFDYKEVRPKRILIVDDDEMYAEMVRVVLEEKIEGVEIQISKDGYEGLILIGEFKPDLVILDLLMPGLDGFKVLELLSARKPINPVKILVLSGNLTKNTVDRLRLSQADGWVAKPVSVNDLLNHVLTLLSGEAHGGTALT